QSPAGSRDLLGHGVIQLPHPLLAFTRGQLLTMHVQPRRDQLLAHALLVQPVEALFKIDHNAGHRTQRLGPWKGDGVLTIAALDFDASQPGLAYRVHELRWHAVGVYVDTINVAAHNLSSSLVVAPHCSRLHY